MYGDEARFWEVKMKMCDTLLQNSDFYINTFLDYILYDNLKSSVCYAIEEEVERREIKWPKIYDCIQQKAIASTPGCAHLAADMFRHPIVVYPENEFVSSSPKLFFPLLRIGKYHRTIEGSEATLQ